MTYNPSCCTYQEVVAAISSPRASLSALLDRAKLPLQRSRSSDAKRDSSLKTPLNSNGIRPILDSRRRLRREPSSRSSRIAHICTPPLHGVQAQSVQCSRWVSRTLIYKSLIMILWPRSRCRPLSAISNKCLIYQRPCYSDALAIWPDEGTPWGWLMPCRAKQA